jgi:class 3 adenylate cyclase
VLFLAAFARRLLIDITTDRYMRDAGVAERDTASLEVVFDVGFHTSRLIGDTVTATFGTRSSLPCASVCRAEADAIALRRRRS